MSGQLVVCEVDGVEHSWNKPTGAQYKRFIAEIQNDRLVAAQNLVRACYVGDVAACAALIDEYPVLPGSIAKALEQIAGGDLEVIVKKA